MSTSPHRPRILLVEAPGRARDRLASALAAAGHVVVTAADRASADVQLASRGVEAIVLALEAAGDSPAGTVRELRSSQIPVVVVCDPARAREAVRLMRHGVADYLIRPPDRHEIRSRLNRILGHTDLESRISFFQDEISKRHGTGSVAADSASMRAVLEQMLRVAPTRSTVLIFGESGVGKELVARAIHFSSPRRSQPFIALNCAAIPGSLIESELFGHERGAFTGAHARQRGKFEIAHRGTLFLDEIGEMGPATQAKLLRVLEAREFMRIGGDQTLRVDVRVIAATNANLEELVAGSRFRQDLYYRLKVFSMRVPPLRERREDIPALVATFLDQLARGNAVPPKSINAAALDALTAYDWPGNVRELKNLVESLLVSVPDESIEPEHLPPYIHRERTQLARGGLEPGTTLAAAEQELIRVTLEHTGGNRTHAAAMLGIGVRTLQRKIRSYGLEIPSRRRRSRRRRAAPLVRV